MNCWRQREERAEQPAGERQKGERFELSAFSSLPLPLHLNWHCASTVAWSIKRDVNVHDHTLEYLLTQQVSAVVQD